jgi:hypothetical protein
LREKMDSAGYLQFGKLKEDMAEGGKKELERLG